MYYVCLIESPFCSQASADNLAAHNQVCAEVTSIWERWEGQHAFDEHAGNTLECMSRLHNHAVNGLFDGRGPPGTIMRAMYGDAYTL